jgi:[protein-PII] uridylyltransferase
MPNLLKHHEKVLIHAERQLALRGKKVESAELLALYKRFLKIENHRLRLKHYSGGGGMEMCRQRATLIDILLRHIFQNTCATNGISASKCPLTLVAVGGYGRGELNPFSDVDIMFLHEDAMKTLPQELGVVIEQMLYLLWDVGFKVGHSTRSITGAIRHANEDMLSKTSLLEARLVTGNRRVFDMFREAFQAKCVDGWEKRYIEDRVTNQSERHQKNGSTVYMQEPNVKNGCGGLRDYQNLMWVSFFHKGAGTTADLVAKKILTDSERRRLDRAYDFLLRVRTELHYLNKRAADSLALGQQFQIANKWEYPQKNALRRGEAFMRDYYQAARTIYQFTQLLAERLSLEILATRPSLLSFWQKRRQPERHFDGFYSEGAYLHGESQAIFDEDRYRMMRMFQHAQQRKLLLSPELGQLVRRKVHLVDRTFQYAKTARETFAAILSRKGEVGRVLRMMHDVDLLGRYLPEFGGLTALVQHEFFHRYTADEHTLVCIEKLDALIDTDNPRLKKYRDLFKKLPDPFVLYLALLLHDSGKAANARNHSEASAFNAQRVAVRHQLFPERRKALTFLVDHHMTLSATAQRRNLDDPATISEFADIVRTQANLDALMLLTLVDGQGTGDENWSDWKETLVWDLYHSTSRFLTEGPAYYEERKKERKQLRAAVAKMLGRDFEDETGVHFDYMPEAYFHTMQAEQVAAHVRLFRRFLERFLSHKADVLVPEMDWTQHPLQGHTEVSICTWDRQELFARLAGAFALAHLNILSADIFTRGDNLVLDVFRVCDVKFQAVKDERDRERVREAMKRSLSEAGYDFMPELQKARRKRDYHLAQEHDFPTRISVLNEAHPIYTVIEIETPDRLGLLYSLLRALSVAGINIVLSRIATEKGAAIDSFYVTDAKGGKITDPAAIKAIHAVLQQAAEAVRTN